MSSVLRGDSQAGAPATPPSSPPPPGTPGGAPTGGAGQRNSTLTLIAGVGVLLLAMGVGVLIGRSGASKQTAAPQRVVIASPTPTGGANAASEASFTSDWPAGTTGYTVQLQALPQASTTVSAVDAAKSAASAKGATAVGALKSEEFSSLAAGSYVIYAGVYHKKAEAEKTLGGLKSSFPGAKVISVSNGGPGSPGGSSSGSGSGSSTHSGSSSSSGSSQSHPAPPSVLNSLKGSKGGKSYEEKSKNLPDVVSTG